MITLDRAKRHLNVDSSYTGEDTYIQECIADATKVVESQICRKFDTLDEDDRVIFNRAVLLLVGDYYANRENTVIGAAVNTLPEGVSRLCHLIRSY